VPSVSPSAGPAWRCRHEDQPEGRTLILLAACLLLWQLVVMGFSVPEYIFPSPVQIAQQFGEFGGPLLDAA
jgi:ABC-type nitrate/sulfonate/bicarbonate transport system permease component